MARVSLHRFDAAASSFRYVCKPDRTHSPSRAKDAESNLHLDPSSEGGMPQPKPGRLGRRMKAVPSRWTRFGKDLFQNREVDRHRLGNLH